MSATLFEPTQAATRPIRFTVYGTPRPQGSTRAFIPKGWRRAIITTDNVKLKPWRQEISGAAIDATPAMLEGPVFVSLKFFLAKPKSLAKKFTEPTKKPDLDKLQRAVFDALTGICFRDDAQIVAVSAEKAYGVPERVEILINRIGDL